MSTMMNKRVRDRMYRGEVHSSSGGALTEPNVLCLAPAGSRGSALSKLPKSHFGIACLYQKSFGYGEGKRLWQIMRISSEETLDCLLTAKEKRMKTGNM